MPKPLFQPGNPAGAGRPKGSRNRLSETFLDALCADFQANGVVDSIDLALIRLCSRIVTACKEESRLQEVMYDLIPGDLAHDLTFKRILALDSEARWLAEQVGRLPAHTMAGVQARAAAVQAIMPIDYGDDDRVPNDWHRGMLDALLRDLMGPA